MGAQYSKVSDNGIKNLNRSDMLTIQFKKESYYEGQVCEGVIIFEPRQRIAIQDILIKFHQSEYIVYVVDEKDTITELNSNVFFEKPIGAGSYLNMNGQGGMISLNPGSYKFPFQFTLPNNIPPSFEYPIKNKRASLRYTFSATVLSPYVKTLTESYIWIKQRPISVPDTIKHENYVNVKNVGIITRGKSGIALFTMENNYRINDMLPFTIDIYNEECGVQVKEVKISLKRTVTFMKGGQQFQHRTAVLRKKYPCVCNKNSKNSFHYDDIQIRDNEFKDADFNRALNPYPFIDDLNLLMPNMRSKLIKCEYSLKATSYFDLSVFEKSRPRVEMPIYITHQLQKEFEYEKNTNQNNGQGQEFFARDYQRGFAGNNNPFQNNNNNQWGNNNNSNNNQWGNNNNNQFGNNNNNQWGNNNKNNNNNQSNSLSSSAGSKKFSYEAYIATKKLNNPNQNNNNNDWKSKSTFQPSSNFGNNNYWNNNNNNNNWNNNNNNNWNNNNWNNNSNNNQWGNNNNNNNLNNNNNWNNNNNNNNNWNNNNWNDNNQNKFGSNFNNGSANPFGEGNNDFPSLENINSNSNNNNPPNPFGDSNNNPPNPFGNNNSNNPPNPFSNNNNPPNPFSNNNNSNNPPNPFSNNNNSNNPPNPFSNNNNPPNPFGNNNNSNNPPNPFGGDSSPYQNSYPGF